MTTERRRKHDDAHRPMSGRGKRGNVVRTTPSIGGQLIEARCCRDCGLMLAPHCGPWCVPCGLKHIDED